MITDQQQQSRRIYLHVKSKSLNFKLETTKILRSSSEFFRFSFLLKLWGSPILIKAKSQPMQVSVLRKRNSLRSKFFRALAKFRNRPTKKTPDCKLSKLPSLQGSIGVVSMVVANLAVLAQGVLTNENKRITVLCLILLLCYFISLWKKFIARKACILMILINFAMVGVLGLVKNNFSYASLLRYAWKAWNWTSSSSQSFFIPKEFQEIFGAASRFL